MDSAKAAVKDFMSKSGSHDTTVHEKVAPAVKHETIEKQKHEQYTSAIDKEVHQDHYHTTEQPIVDKEILPTTHHQNIIPVEHRSYEHGNNDEVEARLRKERAAYQDTVEKVDGATTREIAPVVAGEHKHHHVHETIQPVIQKETIEPHVTHTTVPIHEVHHNAAQHHAASALPAVSMAEFKAQGGSLAGREERQDGFIGEPKSATHSSSSTGLGSSTHNTSGLGSSTHNTSGLGSSTHNTSGLGHSTKTTSGPHDSDVLNKADPRVDSDNSKAYKSNNTSHGLGSNNTTL